MDFYEIFDRVIDLLKQRGRVSYRALKMQFDLSDEGVEALKDELIYAQQLAVDEQERVLVWVGNGGTNTELTTPRAQPPSQPVIQETHPTTAPPPTDHHTPDAERRQLTVMFCDLVDSTKLSSQLDPEDLREVVRGYQQVCSAVITRFDGYIAQYLGDGLLVYFGYPVAHEDDAQRAVRAGLGLLHALDALNVQLTLPLEERLAIRLGVHTGLVVVGPVGAGARQAPLALG